MPEDLKQSLFAELDSRGGVITVRLIGPSIGQREVPIITDIVGPAIDKAPLGFRWLVLDLSQITFMNSMALGMCIDFRNRAAKAGAAGGGGKAALVGLNQQLLDLFRMVKFDRLFTIVKDRDELAKVTAK
jgi:anti-anti-sigma factor